jgi:hypothetical protein
VIKPYVKSLGWNIQADEGLTNEFAQDKVYTYGRTGVPTSHYDFGAPAARMVDKSSAKRMGANVVMFGAREGVDFDMNALAQMEKSLPSDMPAKDEMYTTRPRGQQSRYVFDAGPSEKYAKLMKTLDFAKIYKPKRAVTKATDTVDAYIIKTHPEVADFGHYRGTFVNPKVVILADPIGVDDLITARALTGARGQYLHGMMKELGYGDQYLVIKTVPFGMDGASAEDYANVLSLTRDYRKNLIQEVLKDNPGVELILTDGTQAKVEMQSIVGSGNAKAHVINMVRDDKNLSAGIKEAAQAISQAKGMRAIVSGKMSDIPRSHLSYYARLWEGTSGERVLDAKGASKGIAFAEVAPQWATSQRPVVGDFERVATEKLLKKLSDNGLPAPRESMQNFMKRVNLPAAGNQ